MPNTTDDGGTFFTREQLDEMGESYDPPGEDSCEFCGRPREQRAIRIGGSWLWVPSECNCEARQRADAEKAEEERRREEVRKAKRYLAAGIGRRYLDAAITNADVARWVADFPADGGTGLYLHGCVGCGKTSLASAVARTLINAGRRVVMVTTRGLLRSVQDTFDTGGSTADALGCYMGCDLLILDDIGKESSSDWSLGTMFDVVNERYANLRPTVFTSQYGYNELAERLSRRGDEEGADAVVSRINHASIFIEMPKRDFRMGK